MDNDRHKAEGGRGSAAARVMSGARFIAETLQGYGVTHVFFVEATLHKTLIELEAVGVRRVGTRTEKGAAYMADGYARVSRRPGVCFCQSVGAANLAAGLQDPYLGLSPVIALTGKKLPIAQHRNAYQEIRHAPMFEPVTKYNVAVETIEQLPFLLRQAFREATSGAPRPVHLDIAGGWGAQAIESATAAMQVIIEKDFAGYPAVRPEPEPGRLPAVMERLEKAERPVIVAGGGAAQSLAGPEILQLAEALAIPVATSLNAKGIIPEDHELCVGVVGTYSRACANRVVAAADLVLFIGSGTGDQVTNEWTVPPPGTPVIQIDIDPRELGRSYPNAIPVAGDAKTTVARLLGLVGQRRQATSWSRHAASLVRQWEEQMEPLCRSGQVPMRVERLCREVTRMLPENGVLVVDTGFSGIWTGALVDITQPGQTFLRAAGSLGWAFPAAMGAKCAAPDRPVVCFTGDGGFWYHLSELETAVRCGIKTVTVVNNNHSFGQTIDIIQREYGGQPGNEGDLYLLNDVNFAEIAKAIGCFGLRVTRPEDLADAFRQALASDLPAVIDVVTDIACRAPAPWTPEGGERHEVCETGE